MSERDPREVIREVFRRWNTQDRAFDPDLLTDDIRIESTLTGATFEGRAGYERWIGEIEELFDRWELVCEEILDAGSDRLLVLGSIRLRGRESGVELNQAAAYLCDFRESRIQGFRTFTTHEEGRRAAGLD